MNKSRMIGLSSFKKIVSVITLSGGLLLFPLLSMAQNSNLPCDGENSWTSTCPLDTWVWVLAAIAIIFAVFHLNRKQKSPLPNTEGIQ